MGISAVEEKDRSGVIFSPGALAGGADEVLLTHSCLGAASTSAAH